MSETYPADATLNAMEGNVGDHGMPYMDIAASPYYANKLRKENWLERMLALINACRAFKDSTDSDTQISVYAGTVQIGGAAVVYAGSVNNALTDASTNYVYLDSAGTLTINTTGFPAAGTPHFRIAAVAVAAGAWDIIDDLVDCRGLHLWGYHDGGALAAHKANLWRDYGDFTRNHGGWGSGTLTLTGDAARNNTVVNEMALVFELPADYIASGAVKLVVHAKYAGAGTAGTCTVDAEVYELADAGTAGADLNGTAAVALTNAFGDKTFTVTDAGLAAGDRLMVIVRTSIIENADAGTLNAAIGNVEIQCAVHG